MTDGELERRSISPRDSSSSRRKSLIPRPITPTKTDTVLSKDGYYKSTTPPSPLKLRSPNPISPKHFMNSRSYDKQDLETLKSQIHNKERQLQEVKADLLDFKTKIQLLEVDKVEYDEMISLSIQAILLKQDNLGRFTHSIEQIKEDYERKLELKIKELRVNNDTTVHETEKSYRDEIEKILSSKVSKIQSEKAELQTRLKTSNTRINNSEDYFRKDLKELQESYSAKEQEFKDSLVETRTFLNDSLKELDTQKNELGEELSYLIEQYKSKRQEKSDALERLQSEKSSNLAEDSMLFKLREAIENLKNTMASYDEEITGLQKDMVLKTSKQAKIEEGFLTEELTRRKLHNRLQELKGNIRVFCRVRPPLNQEVGNVIEIQVPDNDEEEQQITISDPKVANNDNPTSTNNTSNKSHNFKFDRVFEMNSHNSEIFEEISQLVQSALDGFNICVFAYGQTGSGKTYTMSDKDGMIPRAVEQIFEISKKLSKKGWDYKIYGEFLEIYNESINDLLNCNTNPSSSSKYEIRHDPVTMRTTVTDLTSVEIKSSRMMNELLERALKNRSIASTKANERSSRSHSVYIIEIEGVNHETGEKNHGILNLIDLAGSERLSHSQATGDRLKETQAINKSLSCLGDVIYALGEKSKHIPFRNSKLTYLLQNSLNGNSKTLMFVNISPYVPHFNETLNSLRFATKVSNTKFKAVKRNNN